MRITKRVAPGIRAWAKESLVEDHLRGLPRVRAMEKPGLAETLYEYSEQDFRQLADRMIDYEKFPNDPLVTEMKREWRRKRNQVRLATPAEQSAYTNGMSPEALRSIVLPLAEAEFGAPETKGSRSTWQLDCEDVVVHVELLFARQLVYEHSVISSRNENALLVGASLPRLWGISEAAWQLASNDYSGAGRAFRAVADFVQLFVRAAPWR